MTAEQFVVRPVADVFGRRTTLAAITVPVAVLWSGPEAPRSMDDAAVADHPDAERWALGLDDAARLDLIGRADTHALLGEPVLVVREVDGWSEVRLPAQPSSKHPDGYPGWVRTAHLVQDPWASAATGAATARDLIVVDGARSATATLSDGSTMQLSVGTILPRATPAPAPAPTPPPGPARTAAHAATHAPIPGPAPAPTLAPMSTTQEDPRIRDATTRPANDVPELPTPGLPSGSAASADATSAPDPAPAPAPTAASADVTSGPDPALAPGTAPATVRTTVAVALPDGRTAAVPASVVRDVVLEAGPDVAGAALDVARLFDGLPYLWAGSSSAGVDCSGLVHLAYRTRGLVAPRDADDQSLAAVDCPLAEVRPGDPVFFANERGIHHVALSTGGTTTFHAPRTGRPVGAGAWTDAAYAGETVTTVRFT